MIIFVQDAKVQWLKEAEKGRLDHLPEMQQWLTETQAALTKAEASLADMQDRLDEIQRAKEQEIRNLESDLSQAWADRDSAARECLSSVLHRYLLFCVRTSYIVPQISCSKQLSIYVQVLSKSLLLVTRWCYRNSKLMSKV